MHPGLKDAIGRAVRERAAIATGSSAPARPVIVKAIGPGRRSRGSVVRLVRYIGRSDRLSPEDQAAEAALALDAGLDGLCPGDRVALFDEWGLAVDHAVIESRLDSWPVLPDRAIRTGAAAGGLALPDAQGLGRVQARHLVLSARVGDVQETPALEVAAAATVRETFGGWGHPALWALHTDHTDRPHVHVAVGTPAGAALPLQRDGLTLDAMRHVFAGHCRACGLEVSAERRCDRPDVGERPRLDELDRLERRVPNWVDRWGAGFLERLARGSGRGDAVAAEASAREMAAEDEDLAGWYRRRRPVAFGPAGESPWPAARAAHARRAGQSERRSAAFGLERLARAVEQQLGAAEADLADALRRRARELAAEAGPAPARRPRGAER